MSNSTFTLQSTLRRIEPLGALAATWRRLLDVVRRDTSNPATRDAEALRQFANRYRESDRQDRRRPVHGGRSPRAIARAQRPGSAADRRR